ncbi:hypothetical protein [Microbulbifer sp. Q7]|uniref:hypothetical protein n=1 Tax=Microbulbifer sp. Q7 TaxID=1785091 RepID=UPI0008323464|nr:hypothetical protein [Microbulbifer sp. Q7]
MLKVRPKLHLVTLNRLLPIFAGAIVLAALGYFGVSETFFYGTFFYLVILAALTMLMALFEPFFSQVNVYRDKICYTTSAGGEIEVSLDSIDQERSAWDKKGLLLVDQNGNHVFLSRSIFSKGDIKNVYEFISETI